MEMPVSYGAESDEEPRSGMQMQSSNADQNTTPSACRNKSNDLDLGTQHKDSVLDGNFHFIQSEDFDSFVDHIPFSSKRLDRHIENLHSKDTENFFHEVDLNNQFEPVMQSKQPATQLGKNNLVKP